MSNRENNRRLIIWPDALGEEGIQLSYAHREVKKYRRQAMPFIDTQQITIKEPLPGWQGRFFNLESMTFGNYAITAGAIIHAHAHLYWHAHAHLYWTFIGPFSALIRREILYTIKRMTENER